MKQRGSVSAITDSNALYCEIGSRVTVARLKAGLSQLELSECVGLTPTSICNLELGRQRTPIDTLIAIAEWCDVSVHDLIPERIPR